MPNYHGKERLKMFNLISREGYFKSGHGVTSRIKRFWGRVNSGKIHPSGPGHRKARRHTGPSSPCYQVIAKKECQGNE